MNPTKIGTVSTAVAVPMSGQQLITLPPDFPIAFTDQEIAQLEKDVTDTSFSNMPMQDIAMLASEAEVNLHLSLGNYLARIEKNAQPKIFKLVDRLKVEVEQAKLPELANKVMNAEPSFSERVLGMFSKKALVKAAERAMEETRNLVTGTSKKLSDVIAGMERDMRDEQKRLNDEVRALEELKEQYRVHFVEFAKATAFMYGFVNKARNEVQALAAQDRIDISLLQDARDKLQALESRALAIEGTMTDLPSQQMVIRQLQNGAISTLQETTTTSSGRFAKIKMTLVTIHGALMTQQLQRTADAGAALSENLQGVNRMLMREVVANAATAPGKNRKAQADQLVMAQNDSEELFNIVEQARVTNAQQFAEVSQVYAQVRQRQQALGIKLRPDLPLN